MTRERISELKAIASTAEVAIYKAYIDVEDAMWELESAEVEDMPEELFARYKALEEVLPLLKAIAERD